MLVTPHSPDALPPFRSFPSLSVPQEPSVDEPSVATTSHQIMPSGEGSGTFDQVNGEVVPMLHSLPFNP
mgnify:CR=1 FL=1